jgi:hypothetical protein
MKQGETRWFEQQRMEWIAETLRIFGFINRGHLMRKFGISTPQASIDLNAFMRRNPGAMYYDLSNKCYCSTIFEDRENENE